MATVELQSNDGKIFPLDIKAAKLSLTIQTMLLDIHGEEEDTVRKSKGPIVLSGVNGKVLEKVMEWCEEHKNDEQPNEDDKEKAACIDAGDNTTRELYDLSGWDEQFMSSINAVDNDGKSMLFDVAIAAKDLNIPSLQNMTTMEIAKLMKDKKQEEIRDLFKLRHPDAKPIGPKKNIKLKSCDEKLFLVDVEAAKMSGTIKTMFEDLGIGSSNVSEEIKEVLPIPNCDSEVLQKVIDWCDHHKDDIESEKDLHESKEDTYELNGWDKEYIESVNTINDKGQSMIFDLIIAANYLNIPGLNDLAVTEVAKMMRGKSQDEIRDLFKLKNDKLVAD